MSDAPPSFLSDADLTHPNVAVKGVVELLLDQSALMGRGDDVIGVKVNTSTAKTAVQVSAAERARDFMKAWEDPEVDVVIASRGGLGGEELLPLLDWERMRRAPKRFVGFSNMTCILNAMVAHGVSHPIAGPNLGSLTRTSTPDSISRLGKTIACDALEPVRLRPVNAAARRGSGCRGMPMGGHVLVLARKTPAPHFPDSDGRVVFLEIGGGECAVADVRTWLGELKGRGVFHRCAGVVLCDFLECGRPDEVYQMLRVFAEGLVVPVYEGYPFGHAPRSYAIDFEREAIVSPDGVLTFSSPPKVETARGSASVR